MEASTSAEVADYNASLRARQFGALHDLSLDAMALASCSQPAIAAVAAKLGEQVSLAQLACDTGLAYDAMPEAARGVALAQMFLAVTRLYDLGNDLIRGPGAATNARGPSNDDPIWHLPELLPAIRTCTRFLSGEIAKYARSIGPLCAHLPAVSELAALERDDEARKRRAAELDDPVDLVLVDYGYHSLGDFDASDSDSEEYPDDPEEQPDDLYDDFTLADLAPGDPYDCDPKNEHSDDPFGERAYYLEREREHRRAGTVRSPAGGRPLASGRKPGGP